MRLTFGEVVILEKELQEKYARMMPWLAPSKRKCSGSLIKRPRAKAHSLFARLQVKLCPTYHDGRCSPWDIWMEKERNPYVSHIFSRSAVHLLSKKSLLGFIFPLVNVSTSSEVGKICSTLLQIFQHNPASGGEDLRQRLTFLMMRLKLEKYAQLYSKYSNIIQHQAERI